MVEEAMDERPAQVEVDQDYAVPRPCESDGEVRGRGRLSLAFERAGDHDRPCLRMEVGELDVGPQRAHSLGVGVKRVDEHRDSVLLAESAVRRRKPGQQG